MNDSTDILNVIDLLPWDMPDEHIPDVLAERTRRYGMNGAA